MKMQRVIRIVIGLIGIMWFVYTLIEWGDYIMSVYREYGFREVFIFGIIPFLYLPITSIYCFFTLNSKHSFIDLIFSFIGIFVFLGSLFLFYNMDFNYSKFASLLIAIGLLILFFLNKIASNNTALSSLVKGSSDKFVLEKPIPISNEVNNLANNPPPLPPMDNLVKVDYFIVVNKEQMGPYDLDKMKVLIEVGQLTMNTQVWKEGMEDWDEAQAVPGLKDLFK